MNTIAQRGRGTVSSSAVLTLQLGHFGFSQAFTLACIRLTAAGSHNNTGILVFLKRRLDSTPGCATKPLGDIGQVIQPL